MIYEFHEVANIFPLLAGDEYESLKEDIKQNGLIESIWLYQGLIIDGRNRYRACVDLGIEPKFREWNGHGSLVSFVVSLNLKRRHLSSSQIAMVAPDIEELIAKEIAEEEKLRKQHQNGSTCQRIDKSTPRNAAKEAAELLGTNRDYVFKAKKIQKESPELAEQIRNGEKTISEVSKQIKKEKNREERKQKIIEASAGNSPLSAIQKYVVVYADPPWKYEHVKTDSRAVENQYPTMELEDICSLPIFDITTEDSVLFLWATNPKLEEAMQVILRWGYVYRTNLVWVKDKIGMGYYVRGQHELLLIATKGSIPVPAEDARPSSVLQAPRREHSQKPTELYDIIENMYPDYPKIELFSRSKHEGWAVWGNQTER